ALHPRHVPRDRRLSRRDQRADADEHRLRHAPLGAVARLGDAADREDGRSAQAPAAATTGRPPHRYQEEVKRMSVILPYEMPALVTTAPLDIHHSTVLPEWVDWNGHMNLAFYVTAFDQASGAFMRNMGLGRRYVDGRHGMTFVLETHVTYDREMKGGAPMRFTTQLLDCDAKRVHLFHEMFHADEGYLAATNETIVMNIDFASRKSAPWPKQAAERLESVWTAHQHLPRPAKAGRVMGLPKKSSDRATPVAQS